MRILLGGLMTAVTLLRAQPETLRLETLIAEALRNNPEVLAARHRCQAARERPPQRSALPDPMVSLGYTSVGSPRPLAGLGVQPMANAGIMFTQEIPAPGKLKLESDIAGQEAQVAWHEYQAIQLSVIARLKQAYYRLHYVHAATEILTRNRDVLEGLLRVTEARYAVGRAGQQDVFKAQIELSLLESRLLRLEQERGARQAEINSLLARAHDAPLGRPENLRPSEPALTLAELLSAAERNSPILGRAQKRIARAELASNLARKVPYPDFALSGGYYNMGAMGSMYMFRVDFKLPLYYKRRQSAAIAEQLSQLRSERSSYEADALNLRLRIQEDYWMAQASSRLMRLYQTTVIPQAGLALEASLNSYETGAVDLLTVLTNFSTGLEHEMNYYEELANYYAALSRLEEATGEVLIR